MLFVGDPAPWFEARSTIAPKLAFDTLGGRYIVLSFLGSSSFPPSRQLLDDIEREQARFDIRNACFCGVIADPADEQQGRVKTNFPGILYFWDFDGAVSRLYGATGPAGGGSEYVVHTLVLDANMRVLAVIPFEGDNKGHVKRICELLDSLPQTIQIDHFAPVAVIPRVFEPPLCKALIEMYERQGGHDIGVLQDVNGQTVRVHDEGTKRRRDCVVTDPGMLAALEDRLRRRVFPEIKKAFQFKATQIERYVIACYDAQAGGFFRAHRDDQNLASAHRRFAVSLGLDDSAYEGGELRFPEFGFRMYRPPTGGAVVFSCTLLHEVRPVTRGRRYAFLPFIYDDEAARIREENHRFLGANLKQ